MGINAWINSIGSVIRDVTVLGFDKGITFFGSGNGSYSVFQNGGLSISSCELYSNYWGLFIVSTNAANVVEYLTPMQMRVHDNTIGVYIGAGNIGLDGCEIVDNYDGVIIDGSQINPAHGFVNNCKINHNGGVQGTGSGNSVLCENLATGTGEDFIGNEILFGGILLSNSIGVKFVGNRINCGVVDGVSGIASSSKGPNFAIYNSYAGTWGAQGGNGMFCGDWLVSFVPDQTTNLIHWGNYSFDHVGDADPYTFNPFQTNNASAVILTNVVPATPVALGEIFQWNSNGLHRFDVMASASSFTWASTNLIH
jgi:hypothetical protein